jgi:hypothetical protein
MHPKQSALQEGKSVTGIPTFERKHSLLQNRQDTYPEHFQMQYGRTLYK